MSESGFVVSYTKKQLRKMVAFTPQLRNFTNVVRANQKELGLLPYRNKELDVIRFYRYNELKG